jgi:catechol 2,3-dioxygenase-like lactoylglutathione lyase family enzyme
MKIEFIASVAVITPDPPSSRRLYADTLELPLTDVNGYLHTDQIPGAKHFGIWPLSQAAESCFGKPQWPEDVPVPQASIEFDVADAPAVQAAADELASAGHRLLHPAKEEPWGQTVARLLSPEGAIVGISFTPPMHE